jgi:hypothetical protein
MSFSFLALALPVWGLLIWGQITLAFAMVSILTSLGLTFALAIPWQRMVMSTPLSRAPFIKDTPRSDMDVALDHRLVAQLTALLAGRPVSLDVGQMDRLLAQAADRVEDAGFVADLRRQWRKRGIAVSEEELMTRLLDLRFSLQSPVELSEAFARADVQDTDAVILWMNESSTEARRWNQIQSALPQAAGKPVILLAENAGLRDRIQAKIGSAGNFFILDAGQAGAIQLIHGVPHLILKNLDRYLKREEATRHLFANLSSLTFATPQGLLRDFSGLRKESPFLNRNTIFLLLNEFFKAMPIQAMPLRNIDRIARAVAEAA